MDLNPTVEVKNGLVVDYEKYVGQGHKKWYHIVWVYVWEKVYVR